MMEGFSFRILCSGVIAAALSFEIYRRENRALSEKPMISPWLQLMIILLILGVLVWRIDIRIAAKGFFDLLFGIFLELSVFYAVLLPFVSVLRRYFRTELMPILWMLPNYLFFTVYAFMQTDHPLFVIRISDRILKILGIVWMLGFIGFMGYHLLTHFTFRNHLLKHAKNVEETELVQLWEHMQKEADMAKPDIRLMRSGQTGTPLSIGLFKATTCVILPEKKYTSEEAELILRHELTHILRNDSQTKFFMVFCQSVCWFNPLMWKAMRRCAEDLELSCDERIMAGRNDDTRLKYAELILNTAGTEKGFTTCLSVNASALRYRLKNIVYPINKRSGAALAGVIFFLMLTLSGHISLAYGELTIGELLDQNTVMHENTMIIDVTYNEGTTYRTCEKADVQAILEYLRGCKVSSLTGAYRFDEQRELFMILSDDKGHSYTYVLVVGEQAVRLTDLSVSASRESQTIGPYYFVEESDFEYLMDLCGIRN